MLYKWYHTVCTFWLLQFSIIWDSSFIVIHFGLLEIKLPWTSVYKSLYGHLHLLLLVKYLGVKGLDHNGRCMFTFFQNCYFFFYQSGCAILHFHQQCMKVPSSPCPNQHFLLSVWGWRTSFNISHSMGLLEIWFFVSAKKKKKHIFHLCF